LRDRPASRKTILVGVTEKKGMRRSGRKKYRNTASSEKQASFLKYSPLNPDIIMCSITVNQHYLNG